jgi:hypothetical protein
MAKRTVDPETSAKEWVLNDEVVTGYHPAAGCRVGKVKRRGRLEWLRSCGTLHIGNHRLLLCVVPGQPVWWVVRNGVLFRYMHGKPRLEVKDPHALTPEATALWADCLARDFLDQETVLTAAATRPVSLMATRYRTLVRGLVQATIVKLAGLGIERTPLHLARACHQDWLERDLYGGPSIVHAVTVALGLRLDDDQAIMLIEYGAWLELRLPVIQREAAAIIWQESVRMLSVLCPAWWIQGAALEWDQLGSSVSDQFWKQFLRQANDVDARGLPLEVATGHLRALASLGASPLAQAYLNRKDTLTEEVTELERRIRETDGHK